MNLTGLSRVHFDCELSRSTIGARARAGARAGGGRVVARGERSLPSCSLPRPEDKLWYPGASCLGRALRDRSVLTPDLCSVFIQARPQHARARPGAGTHARL